MTKVINIGGVNRKLNWVPDRPDHRDFKYASHRFAVEKIKLPPKIDLRMNREWYPVIRDQGDIGSCTGFGTIGCCEYIHAKENKEKVQLSPLFVYYNTRVAEGTVNEDSGAYIRTAVKAVAKLGAPPETLWPYDPFKFKKKPPAEAYKAAPDNKVTAYFRINNSLLLHLKTCLAAGYPFVFGYTVYMNHDEAEMKNGIIPMPKGPENGGHCVACFGYDDEKELFLIRNSWGTNAGDGTGHYYMHYAYVTNPDLADDFWTLRAIT